MRLLRLLNISPLFLLASLALADPQLISGRVVGVADGDTLTVLTPEYEQVKVRLAEIDAPEKAQSFGQVSKKSLSDLAYGKAVEIRVVTTDRYGRTVGAVTVDGQDINQLQVERGLAWAYRKYLHRPELLDVEAAARAAHRGLWADADPIPPWEFRHEKRKPPQ
jgi:endonuclease YncB( thermonuclease family)